MLHLDTKLSHPDPRRCMPRLFRLWSPDHDAADMLPSAIAGPPIDYQQSLNTEEDQKQAQLN